MKVHVGTIDCTPTWAGILNTIIVLLENGNPDGRAQAIKELRNMAQIADLYVAGIQGSEATNFDARISRITALDLLRPRTIHGQLTCLADMWNLNIMNEEYGAGDPDMYSPDGKKQWVGVGMDEFEMLEQSEEYATFELWLVPKSAFHNSEFGADLKNGKFQGAGYAYTIERTEVEPEIFELVINSTSLSELDTDEEGEIASYTYQDEREAEEDIKTAEKLYKINFDNI